MLLYNSNAKFIHVWHTHRLNVTPDCRLQAEETKRSWRCQVLSTFIQPTFGWREKVVAEGKHVYGCKLSIGQPLKESACLSLYGLVAKTSVRLDLLFVVIRNCKDVSFWLRWSLPTCTSVRWLVNYWMSLNKTKWWTMSQRRTHSQ